MNIIYKLLSIIAFIIAGIGGYSCYELFQFNRIDEINFFTTIFMFIAGIWLWKESRDQDLNKVYDNFWYGDFHPKLMPTNQLRKYFNIYEKNNKEPE